LSNSQNDHKFTVNNIRQNWHILDDEFFPEINGIRLVSHEEFTSVPEISVEYIPPGSLAVLFTKISVVYWLIYSIRLFTASDSKSVIIVNGGNTLLWLWCGILNAFPVFGKRKLFCWDVFVEYILGTEKKLRGLPFIKVTTQKKEKLARFILSQYGLNVLWSGKQVATHARHFNLPEHHFIYLPFKANHSKNDAFNIQMGNFIFAGGNGKRDYKCLVEAVRGTDIPVIISATDPAVRKTIEPLPNVIVLGAPEPAFAQLQAASRFVVIPMIYSGLKGGGEANFCNAMWHGKPVIGVDSMAAGDYILDGETGYVVQSGDVETLRDKIKNLWGDPALCHEMGLKGRKHVEKYFTHYKFIRRLLRLAQLYGTQAK
jgi:glycosyltransferase involved in cell wall biosynthesis